MSKEEQEKVLKKHQDKRQRCEVYSRVVGYLRPVNQWNDGKQEEFSLRTRYDRVKDVNKNDRDF